MRFWTSTKLSALNPRREHLFLIEMDLFNPEGSASTSTVWFAKSVTKPGLSFVSDSEEDGKLIGDTGFKYQVIDGVEAFSDIEISLIDPGVVYATESGAELSATEILVRAMSDLLSDTKGFISVQKSSEAIKSITIRQLKNDVATAKEALAATTATADAAGNLATAAVGASTGAPGGLSGLIANFPAAVGAGTSVRKLLERASTLVEAESWSIHSPYFKKIDFGSLDYSSENLVAITITLGYTGYSVTFDGSSSDSRNYEIGVKSLAEASDEGKEIQRALDDGAADYI